MSKRIYIAVTAFVVVSLLAPLAAQAADSFTITTPFVSNALSSCDDLSVSGGVIDSQGFSGSVIGSSGHVLSNGNIKVSGGTVNGNATAGPGKTVTTSGSGKITGTKSSAATAYDCKPVDLTALATALQSSNDNARIPLTGQGKNPLGGTTHLELTLSGGDTLTLSAGTYYFTKFTVSGGSTITITGPVRILSTGNVSISGGSFVNNNPYSLRLWSNGTQNTISGGSTFTGFTYAPSGTLTISASRLYGSAMAEAITVSGSAHVTRLIDDVLPQVTITSPANNSVVSDPSHVVVTGTVSDDTAVTVKVNGQAATIAADGTYQATLNLTGAASPVTITAAATDAANNVGSAHISVITMAAPTLSLTLPAPGSFVNTSVVTLSGGAGTATSVTVDGTPATLANGIWTLQNFNLGTAEGVHTLHIVGTNAGGSTPIDPTLILDLTPPTIQATAAPPANAAGWNNSPVTITYVCSDSLSGIQTCPGAVTVGQDGGGQTTTRDAVDQAGNHTPASVTVNIDTHNPLIAITSPPDNSIAPDPSHVVVTGTVSDDTSPVTVQVNGKAATIAADGTYQVTLDLSGPTTPVTITAVAADAANNSASAHVSVVTIPPPTLSLTLPRPGSFINTSVVTLSGGAGTATSVTVNGSAAVVANGTWTLSSFNVGPEGPHTLNIVGTNAGGSTPISPSLTVDLTPPTIDARITPAPNDAGWNNSAVTITYTCVDALSGIATCPPAASLSTDGAGQTITREAVDNATNRTPASVTVNIDTQNPQITLTAPENNSIVANPSQVVVTGTVSDISPVTVKVNGQTAAVAADGGWQATVDLTGPTSPVTITAVATDAVNNTASAHISVITIPPPTLSLTLPSPGSFVNTSVVTLSGGAGTATSVTVEGMAATVANGSWSLQNFTLGSEGPHTLHIVGTNGGGSTPIAPTLTVDLTPPAIESSITPAPNAAGWNNSAVTVIFTCSDTLSGIVKCPDAVPVSTDGQGQVITREVFDNAGNRTPKTAIVNIDTQKPHFTFTSPDPATVLTSTRVVVTGGSDDALAATVNGVAATINASTKTFTAALTLAEGPNTIVVEGTDIAGNSGTATLTLNLDTRPPAIKVVSPASSTCTNASSLQVTGTASDSRLAGVKVVLASTGTSVDAAVAADGTWTATLPLGNDGSDSVVVTASDSVGHSATVAVPIVVDRIKPVIQLLANGAPFAGGAINRSVAVTARVTDADASAAAALTLGGAPYVAGTPLAGDGNYAIAAEAHDCAGNSATTSVSFTIDTVAPELVSIDPPNGGFATDPAKAIVGTVRDADLASAVIDGSGASATVSGTTFTFHVPLAEGTNNFVLVLTDNAGNVRRQPYAFTLKTSAPTVEIDDSGAPIPNDALFNRSVTPVVRSSDPNAQIRATLKRGGTSTPYTTPTTLGDDGAYTVDATADDGHGHTGSASVTFTIDKTVPDVHITAPAEGAVVATATTAVTVTTTATDVVSVNVNGINAVKAADGSYGATISLDFGANVVTASAIDRAGNSGVAQITVTRNDNQPGIVLTSPGDGTRTNRDKTVVIGQVLTPGPDVRVDVNGTVVTPNAAGAFRLDDFQLREGDNAITATIVGTARKVTVHVVADFTPPLLAVLANGTELAAGQRFDTAPAITLRASDNSSDAPATTLTIDGIDASAQIPALGNGGHSLTATATDKAGNRTRVDVTFFVGPISAGSGVCTMSGFSPADQSVIVGDQVTITGRTTATNILVNGALAQIDSGSFAKTLQQLQQGANPITIRCADASGNATNDAAQTLTYYRSSSAPTITITAPLSSNAPIGTSTVRVTGTVSADAVSGDVNGIPFTPSNNAFAVDNVSLANGLNLITARARNRAGAVGVASVHVTVRTATPKLVITSPLPAMQTGAATIDVSGTYANVDPSTIVVSASGHSAPATPSEWSKTTGAFVGQATLSANSLNTITVTATNGFGLTATATVDILTAPGPSISIATPKDNTFYPSSAAGPDAVTGTITAADGSTVQVNGVQATVNGNSFSATVPFSGTNSVFPIIARVTTPSGATATDSVRVAHLAAPLTVKQTFPEANAQGMDIGAVAVILFSNPIDGSTVQNAVTLVDDASTQITGTTFTDNDAVSFAPDAPLLPGHHYTLRVSQALKDLAGGTLAQPFSSGFTTAGSAPANAPTVTADATSGCLTSAKLTGTASAAGARVRIDVDGSLTSVTAAADRTFVATIGFSGQPGFHVARVVELGADGTASPETDIQFTINCVGPQVVGASLNRAGKTLTIQFSTTMAPATLTASASGTIRLALAADASSVFSGVVAMDASNKIATVTYTADLAPSLKLTVTKSAAAAGGATLAADFVQSFPADSATPTGSSYVAGAVYDASTGRPLVGASVAISPGNIATVTLDHGRYTRGLAEGAYTIEVTAPGYSKVWRQIVIPAGTGVTPIDIRLTQRGAAKPGGVDVALSHGGDTPVTKRAALTVPAAALTSAHNVAVTALGGQSLAGLLPLGWSPYAAAEVVVDDVIATPPAPLSASKLSFDVSAADAAAIAAASQTLSVVQYDSVRDEWRTIVAVATIADTTDPAVKRVTADIDAAGNYALIYGDKAAGLTRPGVPRTGAVLQGVANPCTTTPDTCRMPNGTLTFDKPTVAPSEHSVATLRTDGTAKTFPSGTAVQAYIDELLNLADGSVRIDPPFATDLLLYRDFAGSAATSVFHLAPTTDAAKVTLRDGADHVHIVDYPGRIDRGALLGSEGGRIPGDDTISIDLPAGATIEPIHASLTPTHDSGAIAGFHIVGGFTVALTRSEDAPPVDLDGDGKPDAVPVTLLKPMRGTFTIDNAKFATANRQLLVAEVLGKTAYGKVLRIAATTTVAATQAPGVKIFTTATPDAVVPLEGIIRDGQYLLLSADAPIAYAYGTVRAAGGVAAIANALVQSGIGSAFAPALDVADVTRIGGGFAVPVAAQPASPFSLRPHTVAVGDGQVAVATSSPAPDAFVPLDLTLTPQPLLLSHITPADGAEVDAIAQQITAEFNGPIDPASVSLGIIVNNVTTTTAVGGSLSAVGNSVIFTPAAPLPSGSRFAVSVQPTIRSTAGAPFGRTAVSYFTTHSTPPPNANIHPELISITIPVNGVSTVRGTAGALPAGDNAVLVREGRDFIVRYQATAASDGTFSFQAGNGAADDRIDMLDTIDLQVVDAVSHAVVAVLPLTFVTADGNGFLASPNKTTTFTAAPPLSVSVRVPAGAFDAPTIVKMAASPKSDYADVPSFEQELTYYAGVTLDFDGLAKKPLDLDIPIPSGTTTAGHSFVLGRLGQSALGPRVEIDDLISVDGTKFTTRDVGTTGQLKAAPASVHTKPNDVFVGGSGGGVTSVTVTSGGSGYTSPPTVTFVGGSGTTATAVIDSGFTSVTVTNGGSGYTSAPTIDLVGGGGTGATAVALIQPAVLSINVTNGGSGYTSVPAVELLGGGGIGATASATVSGGTVTAITITNRGVGYTTPPTVQLSGGGGTGATATAVFIGGTVTAINITNRGLGYTSPPTVNITGGGGTGAAASAIMGGGRVISVTVTNPGGPYSRPPAVQFSGGGGSGAAATALVSAGVREYLMHVIASGKYAVTELGTGGTPTAWVFVSDIQANLDLFWSLYHSLYVSQLYLTAGHGRVVMPVISGSPFTVDGVDAATGIKMFSRSYDAAPVAPPGQAAGIPPLQNDTVGPYPVYGTPFNVQIVDIPRGVEHLAPMPGIAINMPWATSADNGQTEIKFTSAPALTDPARHLDVLNTRTGVLSTSPDGSPLNVNVNAGDRLVLMVNSERIEPRSDLSIVFNEALYVDAQTPAPDYLKDYIELQRNFQTLPSPAAPNWLPLGGQVTILADSGNRRVRLNAPLEAGTDYRLRLKKTLAHDFGGNQGLPLGSPDSTPKDDLFLYFSTRKPAGDILNGPFTIAKGSVRDLALDGNLLFVSALEGGLLAYNVGDAGQLNTKPPIARALALPDIDSNPAIPGANWAVEVDKHGRVWTTALTSMFGVVRTFRTEDFANATATSGIPIVQPFAGGTVSWRPGATVGLDTGLSTTILSDRPEATPRKMQIVVQDDSLVLIANAGVNSPVDLDKAIAPNSSNQLSVTGSRQQGPPLGDFNLYHLDVPTSGAPFAYLKQRITVRNTTAGLRWSQDGLAGPAAGPNGFHVTFDDVLVRPGDTISIERNMATYGVVSHFGYGVGVYDLNAIESNSLSKAWPGPGPQPTYKDVATQLALTNANERLTFSPDAALTVDSATGSVGSPTLHAFALVSSEGILVVDAKPIGNSLESNGDNTTAGAPLGADVTTAFYRLDDPNGLPELHAIKQIVTAGGRPFVRRFGSISRFDRDKNTYILVSGGQYGILVFNVTTPNPNLVDVIWIAKGAFAVRSIGGNYATAIDGDGRALLIDLSHVDESGVARVDVTGAPWNCGGCAPLFPTVAAALKGGPASDPYRFGNDDPRVVWRSEQLKDANGDLFGVTTLAPPGDPETGLIYDGAIQQNAMYVLSAIDPRVALMVNLGGGKLTEVGAIVPLGVAPNASTAAAIAALPACGGNPADNLLPTSCRENASAGAFRIETSLPGQITDLVGNPGIAIESERVPGGIAEQTREPLPPSHIRRYRAGSSVAETRGTSSFVLQRVIRDSYPNIKTLKLQKGFNKFVSPWVLAIADPRASTKYTAPRAGEDDGCFSCAIPLFLQNKTLGTDFFEIYTIGRYLAVRPEVTPAGSTASIFDGAGKYKYLGDKRRVFARFGTIMADTVRPPQALVAANAPPVASGKFLETVYLHSGEVESSAVDLDAGGRAGWNVVFDRTYRSRTVGTTPVGFGWDSGIFKRLRFMPNGDVEYRDGGAEVWRYRFKNGAYVPPTGYTGHLLHAQEGWTLIGQKLRITYFDELGRVVREADEFYTPDGKGNAINYVYDDSGRLATIVDATNRPTKLVYYNDVDHDGMLNTVTDWRGRIVKYNFDTNMRLDHVDLPHVNTIGGAFDPQRKYEYDAGAGGGYNNDLELATNLKSIRDPNEAPSGTPRVTFTYGSPRDYVNGQTWGTPAHETATFGFGSSTATTTDVLGQERAYTFQMPPTPAAGAKLDWYSQDRAHALTMTERSVETSTASFGTLPTTITPGAAPTTTRDRSFTYDYDTNGYMKSETLAGVYTRSFGYQSAGQDLGFVANCTATSAAGTILCGGSGPTPAPGPNDVKITTSFRTGGFVDAITANNLTINQHEAFRDALTPPDDVNNQVTSHSEFFPSGLPHTTTTTGGTATCNGAPCAGSTSSTDYHDAATSTAQHKRGLPAEVKEGTANTVTTTFDYPDQNTTRVTDARGVTTKTVYDEWRRPKTVTTTGPDPLTLKEEYVYDASGNLIEHHRTQGGSLVKTTYGYDVIGRHTSVTTDHVAVGSNPTASVTETTDYTGYANGTIIHTGAGGAVTTATLDKMGRTKRSETAVGSSPVKSVAAYDLAGNPVFSSDTTTYAAASAYDANGRRMDVLRNDGTSEHVDYDAWGRATDVNAYDRSHHVTYHRHTDYEPGGQVKNVAEDGGAGTPRSSEMKWDGGGRTAAVAANGGGDTRVIGQEFDDAGRILKRQQGTGSTTSITPFVTSTFEGYNGSYLAPTTKTAETQPGGHTYTAQRGFDTAGNTKDVSVGSLSWSHEFDEAGNATKVQEPSRPPQQIHYDARGNVTNETLPDGATQSHKYHATGASSEYKDPGSEVTSTVPDELGRPTVVNYVDGTTERIVYDGANVLAVKDRQDRWQSFRYENGHVTEVWASPTPGSGTQLDKIEYADGAHLTSWTNRDAKIEYSNFTQDGLPKTTIVTHYKNGSGLSASPTVLDTFTQSHDYNGHGEVTQYSLPSGGSGFASTIHLDYDAMGNLETLQRDGTTLLTGDYIAAGRPHTRTLTLPSGKPLLRTYSYKADTGQLEDFTVEANGTLIAGSKVDYNSSLQVTDVTLHGVSGGVRHTRYSYDARSRLYGSITATTSTTAPPTTTAGGNATAAGRGVAEELLDPADFRKGQDRTPALDATTRSILEQAHIDTTLLDPPTQTATPALAHKIDTFTRGASTPQPFDYAGKAERVDDGQFHYHYDEKGRLDWAAEVPTSTATSIRRVAAAYDGNNRLVGRTAQFAAPTTITAPIPYDTFSWATENRSQVINADGLPAETTFIWDPVSDRLIAVLRTGDSAGTTDPYNNVLKQVIHGDMGYDDPVEVTSIDQGVPVAPGTPPPLVRLYPVYDEAAGGTLQVVVNSDALVVARSSNNDPFGSEEFDLGGAAIDKVSIEATKTSAGALSSVKVTMRATEQLAAPTIATGARLAVVDANGLVLRTATAPPTLPSADPFSVAWTVSPADWTALTDTAPVGGRTPVSLSIAATNTLRAAIWSFDLPILPAPAWATTSQPVFSSSTTPVEIRTSLSNLSTFINGIANGATETTTPYEVLNLSNVGVAGGSAPIENLLAATFQAMPFAEAFTKKFYVRARWYDPLTGTWLSPDPEGYIDSSNLYAFAGGDPVNNRDPYGTKIKLTGANRGSDYLFFKKAIAMVNPAAAAQLRLVADKNGDAYIDFAHGEAAFRATAVQDSNDYLHALSQQGIPQPTDRRSFEDKFADLIKSPTVVEYSTGQRGVMKSDDEMFGDTKDIYLGYYGADEYGGAVTIESWASLTGNTQVLIDPAHINRFWLSQVYGTKEITPELALLHEFGHAMALQDPSTYDYFYVWGVEMENQVRGRTGENIFRTNEWPLHRDWPLKPQKITPRVYKYDIHQREKRERERRERMRKGFPCGRDWCGDARGW